MHVHYIIYTKFKNVISLQQIIKHVDNISFLQLHLINEAVKSIKKLNNFLFGFQLKTNNLNSDLNICYISRGEVQLLFKKYALYIEKPINVTSMLRWKYSGWESALCALHVSIPTSVSLLIGLKLKTCLFF